MKIKCVDKNIIPLKVAFSNEDLEDESIIIARERTFIDRVINALFSFLSLKGFFTIIVLPAVFFFVFYVMVPSFLERWSPAFENLLFFLILYIILNIIFEILNTFKYDGVLVISEDCVYKISDGESLLEGSYTIESKISFSELNNFEFNENKISFGDGDSENFYFLNNGKYEQKIKNKVIVNKI